MQLPKQLAPYRHAAETILADKMPGSCIAVPYMFANATRRIISRTPNTRKSKGRSVMVDVPYYDPNSDAPCKVYYGMVQTDRVGCTSLVMAGGEQDIVFMQGHRPHRLELGKPSRQARLLKKHLGIDMPKGLTKEEANLFTVAALCSVPDVKYIRVESPFEAAMNEAKEEHGWDYQAARGCGKILRVDSIDRDVFSVRSHKHVPAKAVKNRVFAVAVTDFTNVSVVWTDKIEKKAIDQRGQEFYEHGTFLTKDQAREIYAAAIRKLGPTQLCASVQSRLSLLEDLDKHINQHVITPVARRSRMPRHHATQRPRISPS